MAESASLWCNIAAFLSFFETDFVLEKSQEQLFIRWNNKTSPISGLYLMTS